MFYTPAAGPLLAAGGGGPAGGAETQVLLLARGLARRGHAVGIVAFGGPGGLRTRVDGVDVIEHERPATRLPVLRTLAFYRAAFRTLRANPSPVVVQRAAGVHTALVAVLARLLRFRFVYASAGLVDFDLRSFDQKRWVTWAFARGIRRADTVVVQNEEQAALCRARFGRDARLITSLAEAEAAPAPAPREPPEAFLWIGALIAHKQPLALVELARAVPEARFRMVGMPVATPAGAALAADVGRAAAAVPNLELLPPRPRAELGPLLDRAVAVVSTSRSEGMPNVFLEGWGRGVPALALSHDPDGVIAREGLGASAGSSPERLAELARAAWRARDDGRERADRCRAYIARAHAPEPILDAWAETLGL